MKWGDASEPYMKYSGALLFVRGKCNCGNGVNNNDEDSDEDSDGGGGNNADMDDADRSWIRVCCVRVCA